MKQVYMLKVCVESTGKSIVYISLRHTVCSSCLDVHKAFKAGSSCAVTASQCVECLSMNIRCITGVTQTSHIVTMGASHKLPWGLLP